LLNAGKPVQVTVLFKGMQRISVRGKLIVANEDGDTIRRKLCDKPGAILGEQL
jgi:hypothetical protein